KYTGYCHLNCFEYEDRCEFISKQRKVNPHFKLTFNKANDNKVVVTELLDFLANASQLVNNGTDQIILGFEKRTQVEN
ncbi:MAG: hypothetical protein LBF70_01130, partial [Holosporales bacterium]|nr:hypothetical protein [Holosporales bacterium]